MSNRKDRRKGVLTSIGRWSTDLSWQRIYIFANIVGVLQLMPITFLAVGGMFLVGGNRLNHVSLCAMFVMMPIMPEGH